MAARAATATEIIAEAAAEEMTADPSASPMFRRLLRTANRRTTLQAFRFTEKSKLRKIQRNNSEFSSLSKEF